MTTIMRPKAGFSLMEILIALAIMGLIVSVVGVAMMNYFQGAKISTTKQQLREIKNAVDYFNTRQGVYPDRLDDLVKKPTDEELAKDWIQYIPKKEVPRD